MMIQTSRHNGSTWRKCGETHVKKLLEEERLNTKSGFLLIPWGNWMCKRKRKWHWTQAGQEQWKQKLTTQQQIKMLRKHQVKQDHIDKLAKQAEEAAGQGIWWELYMITKKLSNKLQQTEKPMKDKNGNPLTKSKEGEMSRTHWIKQTNTRNTSQHTSRRIKSTNRWQQAI